MTANEPTLEQFLAPISRHLGHAVPHISAPLETADMIPPHVTDGLTHDQLVERFVSEATALRAEIHRATKETLPDVLDAKLLASALSISKAGAYQLLNRPDFPTLQVGGRKLVTKQKLALWMEQHTNKAKQAGAGKEKKADETDKV